MKQYDVILHEDADDDLAAIRRYIAEQASIDVADRYVAGLLARCRRLSIAPRGGSPRDDLGAGVRTIAYKRAITIVYRVRGGHVTVIGFFYRGRDVARALHDR